MLLDVLLRCPSARSWIAPLRHPSTGSWIVPAVTQEDIFWVYEFRTRCHCSSGLADYFMFFFPVTSTTRITYGQSVSAMHVLLSVLFYEWAHGCPSAGSWISPVLCPSERSWIAPLRHPSAGSWILPVVTQENIYYKIHTLWLTIFSFLPITSTTSLRQQARAEGSS